MSGGISDVSCHVRYMSDFQVFTSGCQMSGMVEVRRHVICQILGGMADVRDKVRYRGHVRRSGGMSDARGHVFIFFRKHVRLRHVCGVLSEGKSRVLSTSKKRLSTDKTTISPFNLLPLDLQLK